MKYYVHLLKTISLEGQKKRERGRSMRGEKKKQEGIHLKLGHFFNGASTRVLFIVPKWRDRHPTKCEVSLIAARE